MSTTVLGATMDIQADITGTGSVHVLGRLAGSISVDGDVLVEQQARAVANIRARNVDVLGEVEGNIRASDRVEVARGGRVTGDIRAPRILIDSGAQFKGNVAFKE